MSERTVLLEKTRVPILFLASQETTCAYHVNPTSCLYRVPLPALKPHPGPHGSTSQNNRCLQHIACAFSSGVTLCLTNIPLISQRLVKSQLFCKGPLDPPRRPPWSSQKVPLILLVEMLFSAWSGDLIGLYSHNQVQPDTPSTGIFLGLFCLYQDSNRLFNFTKI